jgi:hypothetical protein
MPHFETRPSFLHWNSAKLFATLKAPVFITWSQCVPCVSMLQRTTHASMASTCATPCNAMLHCFHSKHFLRSVEICVQHWIFVVCIEKHWVSVSSLFSKFSTSLCSRMVEKDVCGQNGAVRTRNLERNREKTYIASAGSASAKRSWGPGWKFDIALGCLKLQDTEF